MSAPYREFDELIQRVQSCRLCARMCESARVLSWANGDPLAPMMFIGEAPGRLGADRTAIPFHGDKAGDNFERLIELAGLTRSQIFVTNAVLCNPRDALGNNSSPSPDEIVNCARHLKSQIEFIRPAMVMTLGAIALEATRRIENHGLSLREGVRTSHHWFGRLLLPLYHPGARAMIHRSFPNQVSDYYFVAETFHRLGRNRRKPAAAVRGTDDDWKVVTYVLQKIGAVTNFRLHKLMYLIDLAATTKISRRATHFFYIRQKDGPYCVELGSRWYSRFGSDLRVCKAATRLTYEWKGGSLFEMAALPDIPPDLAAVINEVLESVVAIDDGQLKTRAYLTEPMKRLLRAEKAGQPMLNRPLLANLA
jgi:uracil-DNA glycosylase family 4